MPRPCQGRAMCQPVVEASKVWKLDADKESSGVTLYTTIRTHTGHPQDTHQHNLTTTMKLRTSYVPANQKHTAQEAHRAMRWRETSDFHFGCADERKYPITYKDTRGQSPMCNPSTYIPLPTTQSSNLAIPIQKLSNRSRPNKRLFVVYPTRRVDEA